MNFAHAIIFFATFFLASCAAPTKTTNSISSEIPSWHGRLAVRVEADLPQSPSQSFSSGFELSGNPLAGGLTLYTPLGTTAATLTWTPQTAALRTNGDIRYFESLADLIKQAVGTEIPVTALFAWLAGDNMVAAGWSADLSQQSNGKITARRMEPAPQAELRLMLEK